MTKTDIKCSDCIRWYFTKADQCEIPNPGVNVDINFNTAVYGGFSNPTTDVHKLNFLKTKQRFTIVNENSIDKRIFGKPSQLNINNDCVFYKGLPKSLRWFTGIFRFFYGV